MSSILYTVKQMIGLAPTYDPFDLEIIADINAALMSLVQIGVGPEEGFIITGPEQTWEEFAGERADLGALQNYVALKVKTVFDPPSSSHVLDSMNKLILEYEWRMNIQVEEGGDNDAAGLPGPLRSSRNEMGCPEG